MPPLDYDLGLRREARESQLTVVLHGGILNLDAAGEMPFTHVDGVMLGRAAYQNPELLIGVDPEIFGEPAPVADAFEALDGLHPRDRQGS